MDWELTLSKSAFTELLARLTSDPGRVNLCPAGLGRLAERRLVLVHGLDVAGAAARKMEARLVVVGSTTGGDLQDRVLQVMRRPPVEAPAVYLGLGVHDARGHVAGETVSTGGIVPLESFRVVAETLPQATLGRSAHLVSPQPGDFPEMWSRTIGALQGETWEKLTGLRVVLFGCGRTGSLVSNALARTGVRDLTLVDPDRLELHNLGEMDGVTLKDTGRSKVESVAESLRLSQLIAGSVVRDLVEPAFSLSALVAAKEGDFLISCVDNAAARLTVAILGTLFLKPTLDIATGILGSQVSGLRMGADVRLLLPGQCLVCFGGIAGVGQGAAELSGVATAAMDWRNQRAGSLRSLNMVAVGSALRLMEDFLAGRVGESTWLSLDYSNGMPRFRQNAPVPLSQPCPVCALTAAGDAGLSQTQELLRLLTGREAGLVPVAAYRSA